VSEGATCRIRRCSNSECRVYLADRKDGYCLECRSAYMRFRAYGVTREEYAALVDRQGNACAICMRPFISEPHVDHNHKTNEVRGLLCQNCNTGIGKLGDDIKGLLRAATYLAEGI
jgi:hypothetical protein